MHELGYNLMNQSGHNSSNTCSLSENTFATSTSNDNQFITIIATLAIGIISFLFQNSSYSYSKKSLADRAHSITNTTVDVQRVDAAISFRGRLRQLQDWTRNELPAKVSTIGTTALQTIRSTLPNQPSLERAALTPYLAGIALAFIVETLQGGKYPITTLWACGTLYGLKPNLQEKFTLMTDTLRHYPFACSFPNLLMRGAPNDQALLPAPLAGKAEHISDPSNMDNLGTAIFITFIAMQVLNMFLGSEIHNPFPLLALIGAAFAIGSGVKKAKDEVSFVQSQFLLAGGVDEDVPAHPKVPFEYNFTMASVLMGMFVTWQLFPLLFPQLPLLLNIALGAAGGPAVRALAVQQIKQLFEDVKRTTNGQIAGAAVGAINTFSALLPRDVDSSTLQGRVVDVLGEQLFQARRFIKDNRDNLVEKALPLAAFAAANAAASARAIFMDENQRNVAMATVTTFVQDTIKGSRTSALGWLGNNAARFTIQSIAVPFLQKLWKLQKTADGKAFIQGKLNLITKHRLETEPQQLLMAILQLPTGCLIEGVEVPPTLQAILQAFTGKETIALTKKNPAESCEEDRPIYDKMVDTTINPRAEEFMDWLSQEQEFNWAARPNFTKTLDGDITTKQQIEKEVAKTTELFILKGIYKLFESSGGKAEPFEAILELMIKEEGKLTGDIKRSSQSFVKKLHESMHVVGKTNPLIRGFIGTILLPAITSTVVEMGQNSTKKFFEKAKVQIGEQLSSDGNNGDGNNELLNSFSALFNKVSNAIDAHVAGGALSSTSLVTREEFINNKVKGDPKETEKSYRNLTHTFVDTFCPTPLNAAGKLAKTRSELMDKLTGPELSGAKKILMTPLYAVAIAVMWIVEHVFVRWAEWCINKIVTAFIKKSADDAKIMESLVTSAVDAIKGKNNGGRGTEIMDTLIEEVLILANQAISEELKDGSAASAKPLSPEENKASKEFVRSFIEAVNKYSTTNEDTLEARIKKMLSPLTSMGIGITFDRILDLLAPHIHKLYKEITTEEKLDELTVLGLKALNTTLQRTDDVTKVTKTQLEERKQEEQTRKNKIANQIEVLSKQLFELIKKDIKTEVVELTDNVQPTILNKFNEFSNQSLLAIKAINEDHTSVECKIDIIESCIENLVEFKEFTSSTASSKSISQDLKGILGNAYHTLSELITLFRNTEIRLHASIITEQEKYLIQKIKELSSNQESSLKQSINAMLEEYKNLPKAKRPISEVQIMKQLAIINEVIEVKGKHKEEEGYYTAAISLLNQIHSNTLSEPLRKSYMELVHNKKPKNMSQNVWNDLIKLIRSSNVEGFSVRKQNMLNDLTIKLKDACNQSVKCSTKINALIEDVKKITQDYEQCFITTEKADLPRIIQETESLFGKLTEIFNTKVKSKLNLRLGLTEGSVGLLGLVEPFFKNEMGKYLHQATAALPFLTAHAIDTVGLETAKKILTDK